MSFFIPNFFISGVHISRRACTFLWVYTHFLYFGEQSWLIVSWGRNTWEKKPLLCQFLRKCLWDLRLFNILNYFQCWDSIQPYISCLSYNFLFKGFTSNSSHVVRFFFMIYYSLEYQMWQHKSRPSIQLCSRYSTTTFSQYVLQPAHMYCRLSIVCPWVAFNTRGTVIVTLCSSNALSVFYLFIFFSTLYQN